MGCSNHMCGEKSAFSEMDESFQGTIRFSTVFVIGKGNLTIRTKENFVMIISNVFFFVPDLKKKNCLALDNFKGRDMILLLKKEFGEFNIQRKI